MFQKKRKHINERGTPSGGIITYTQAKEQNVQSLDVKAVLATLAYRTNTQLKLKKNQNCATVLIEYEENGATKIAQFSAHSTSILPEQHAERIAWGTSQNLRNRNDIKIKNIIVHSERSSCNVFEENKNLPDDEKHEVCTDSFNRELEQYGEKAKFICSVDQQAHGFKHKDITEALMADIGAATMPDWKKLAKDPSSHGDSASTNLPNSQTRDSNPVDAVVSTDDKGNSTKPTSQIASESFSSKLSALNTAAEQKRNIGETLSSSSSALKTISPLLMQFMRRNKDEKHYLLSKGMNSEEEANKLKIHLSELLHGKVNKDSIKKEFSVTGQWQIKVEGTEDEVQLAQKIIKP